MKGQFLITVESQLINGERTMEIKKSTFGEHHLQKSRVINGC